MQNTFTVQPVSKPLYTMNTENSHPRLSLRRVLWVKFLRWIEKSPLQSLWWSLIRCLTLLLGLCAIIAPSFTVGMLTASFQWNNYRVPLCLAVILLTVNVKRLWQLRKLFTARQRKLQPNQHTYQGIPVDEFASYLLQHGAFTTEAMNRLALPQRKWAKIADELEKNGILKRGENNARVLAEITREDLVRQLRDGFPLVFDEVGKTWVERRGSFDRFLLDRERKEKKEAEQRERLERKEDRMRKNIARMKQEQNGFASVMSMMG